MRVRTMLLAAALLGAALPVVARPAPAHAAYPGEPGGIAFIRGGNVWEWTRAGGEKQVTHDGNDSWPRWQPGGSGTIAYVHNGDIWLVETGDIIFGNRQQLTHGASAGAPSWSPDGTRLVYLDGNVFSGRLTTIRLASSNPQAVRRTVIKSWKWPVAAAKVRTFSKLRTATGVAWSPDGKWIAFPGGDCLGIYDACLSVVDVVTNEEHAVAAFSGGGDVRTGFATVPAWTADSSRLTWTQQATQPENHDAIGPVQIISADINGPSFTQLGRDGDSAGTPSPRNDGTILATTTHNGRAWIVEIGSAGGRSYLFQGYQQDWQPVPPTP